MRNQSIKNTYLTKEKIKYLATECKKPRLAEESMMAEFNSRLKKIRADKAQQIEERHQNCLKDLFERK